MSYFYASYTIWYKKSQDFSGQAKWFRGKQNDQNITYQNVKRCCTIFQMPTNKLVWPHFASTFFQFDTFTWSITCRLLKVWCFENGSATTLKLFSGSDDGKESNFKLSDEAYRQVPPVGGLLVSFTECHCYCNGARKFRLSKMNGANDKLQHATWNSAEKFTKFS